MGPARPPGAAAGTARAPAAPSARPRGGGAPVNASAALPTRVRPALLLALAALLVFLLLGQNQLHGIDAYQYLRSLEGGRLQHPRTFFYLPLAAAFAALLAPFGVERYEAVRALSALGAAGGVFCLHLAAQQLGLDRRRAALVALGAAATPAVLYTASVVEVDALLFGCACLCWLPLARLLRSGQLPFAVLTGACTALAAGFHAAGHLLAGSLCALVLAWDWPARSLRRSLPQALVVAGTHAGLSLLLALLTHNAAQAQMAGNTLQLGLQADLVGRVLGNELLLPYLPWLLVALWALRRRRLSAAAAMWLGCTLAYLLVTLLVLGYQRANAAWLPQGDITERGSFLLGLCAPMLLLAVQAVPLRLGVAAAVLAALSGVLQIRLRDWPDDPPGYTAGVAELERGGVILLLADAQEWAWVVRRLPLVECRLLAEPQMLAAAQPGGGDGNGRLVFEAWLAIEYNRARDTGRRFVVSERALAALRGAEGGMLATGGQLLQAQYELQPLAVAGFRGSVLRRR